MASRAAAALAALVGCAAWLGCASLGLGLARGLPDGGPACPGALAPTQALADGVLLEQRVRVQGEGLDWQLSLAARQRGDTLVLIGLDAFGAKLFVLTQTAAQVAVDRPRGRLPFSPELLLRDWQRARLATAGAEPEAGVTLVHGADGSIAIEHARCGYRATFVTLAETPLPAPAAPPR